MEVFVKASHKQWKKWGELLFLLRRGKLTDNESEFLTVCNKRLGFLESRTESKLSGIADKYFGGESCGHGWIHLIHGDFGIHYAKRVCHYCERFVGWEPHPEDITTEGRVEKILKKGGLNKWDTEFLWSIRGRKTLTKAHHIVLKEILGRVK